MHQSWALWKGRVGAEEDQETGEGNGGGARAGGRAGCQRGDDDQEGENTDMNEDGKALTLAPLNTSTTPAAPGVSPVEILAAARLA